MRLTAPTVNDLLDALGVHLNGGTLTVFNGSPPDAPDQPSGDVPLAVVTFPSPAFHPASDGRAVSLPIDRTVVLETGDARWGQLTRSDGSILGDVVIRAMDDPDADEADLLANRTDFHRGGPVTLGPLTLKLPRSS